MPSFELQIILSLAVFSTAFVTGKLCSLFLLVSSEAGRYRSLDGLRGCLAISVLIHHSIIWYLLLHGRPWSVPPSILMTEIGQICVCLFFMITAFLFVGKLLHSRDKKIDWSSLYRSRFFRIAPLFFANLAFVLLIVALQSGLQLNVPWNKLLKSIGRWAIFTIPGIPDINGHKDTYQINAGVMWSLGYEWLFYVTLPLIALILNGERRLLWLLGSAIASATIFHYTHDIAIDSMFAGGTLAAFLVRKKELVKLLKGPVYSVIAVLALLTVLLLCPTAYALKPLILLSFVFLVVASGNSFFGIFHSRVSIFLGEISYSIYLVHGLVLYVLLNCLVGKDKAATLSFPAYLTFISLAVVPLVVILSTLTFRLIEQPGMRLGKRVHDPKGQLVVAPLVAD